MTRAIFAAWFGLGAILTAPAAGATIIDGAVSGGTALAAGGMFVKLTVPFTESNPDNTVGNDTFQSPNLWGFDEGQNILVPGPLNVDDLADGLGGGSGPGVIPGGTIVASHYVFFDPGPVTSQEGFVEFDSDILGVISSTANLADSDFLISTGVTYLNPTLRGLEAGQDTVTIVGLRQISVDWLASTPGDYIRVLTAFSPGAVPVSEPGTLVLLGVGLAGAGALGCRRLRRT